MVNTVTRGGGWGGRRVHCKEGGGVRRVGEGVHCKEVGKEGLQEVGVRRVTL